MVDTTGLTQPYVAAIHAFVDRDVDATLCPGHLLPMLASAEIPTDRQASAHTDHEAKAQHDAQQRPELLHASCARARPERARQQAP